MKIFKNLIHGIYEVLSKVLLEGKYPDLALKFLFAENKKWGARDRKFVAEACYDIIRFKRYYQYLGDITGINGKDDIRDLTDICLLLTYEDYRHELKNGEQLLQSVQRRINRDIPFAVRESVPDWLDAYGRTQLGVRWEPVISALNKRAPLVIRANTLKITREKLNNLLNKEGFTAKSDPLASDSLILDENKNVNKTEFFKNGFFEIQDTSSQNVGIFLAPEPGMRVIDACAGGGGKSLHIATLMKNKGKLISMDVEQWKLDELKKRARRNGISIIESKVIEGSKTIKRLAGSADRVLLDVPCSGSGVFRRNPDAKWKLTPEQIEALIQTQEEILRSYSRMVKPGGELVYATCSIFPDENENQVKKFLSANNSFLLLEEKWFSPDKTGSDGFYMAKLKRTAESADK